MGPITDNLRAKIAALRTESTGHRYFVSQKDLSSLLTKETIAAAIPECGIVDYRCPAAVTYVLNEGTIIFGILVWRKWEHTLSSFIENSILDGQLPLAVEEAQQVTQMFGFAFATDAQWDFLPRQLTKEMSGYHCRFRKEEILPFTQMNELGAGTFGDVYKVEVWPSCQTIYPQTSNVVVVLKKLKLDHGKEEFQEREEEALGILRYLKHPNIVPLLASYSHLDSHCLLFPLYKMDLEQLMKLDTRPEGFEEDLAFFMALEGLSSALEKVHNLKLNAEDHDLELARIGYHHDIRPANVLVGNSFYLADFGLAKLKKGDEGSKTGWKAGLLDYIGPECMDEKWKARIVGRPLDIWAYGCMILELASYIHGGAAYVTEFRENRQGPESLARPHAKNSRFFRDGHLRSTVVAWSERLRKETGSALLSHLVSLAMSMLKIEPKDRPNASEVHQQLSYLRVKGSFDATQREFSRFLGIAQRQVDNLTSVMAIKLQEGRLSAWGKVLQLGNPPVATTITTRVSEGAGQFCDALNGLLEKLGSPTNWPQGGTAEPPPAAAFSISKPLHEELQGLIDRLWAPLPATLQEEMERVWLTDSLVTDNPTTLQAIASSTRQEYTDLNQLASAKLEQLHLKFSEFHKSADVEGSLLVLGFGDLSIEEYSAEYGLGQYRGRRILIEWIMRLHEWEVLPEAKKGRIKLLAEVLSRRDRPIFRVLDCVGLVVSREGCGFVTAYPSTIPPGIQDVATPISLFEVFATYKKYDLPLGRRFQLAYQLVNCVWELHTAGWLHKNISSRNVLFFADPEEPSPETVLEHPYLVNFRDSRPAVMAWATEVPAAQGAAPIPDHSKHPDYSSRKSSFKDIYDYYAIGQVLLELGSWATMDDYIGRNPEYAHDAAEFRDMVLVKQYAHRLSYAMGMRYQDATLACLMCDFGQDEEGIGRVLDRFYDKVVEPLSELSGYHI